MDFGLEIGVATVIGGAMFGDNISMISDTTIAAVSTQGALAVDKLKLNLKTASIASIMTIVYLTIISNSAESVSVPHLNYLSIIKIIPYITLIIMGLFGINVMITLAINIITAGILGVIFFNYNIVEYSNDIYRGFEKVNKVMIFAMFVSGLSYMMYKQGEEQLNKIIDKINMTKIKAEFLISGLCSMFNILVANNTIAILLSGDIANKIRKKCSIATYRSAYLLDPFSCIIQGLIPYGAQLLLASSLSSLSPTSLITKIYYYILAIVAISEIVFYNWREKSRNYDNFS